MIGSSDRYELTRSSSGWNVHLQHGWGDCPAGCIHHREWNLTYDTAGTVVDATVSGEALPRRGWYAMEPFD